MGDKNRNRSENEQRAGPAFAFQTSLPTEGAASELGIAAGTLKQSRYTGVLFGRPAPRYRKLGRLVRYSRLEIERFRQQFPEYQNTSEANFAEALENSK